MTNKPNPYLLMFGQEPKQIISRDEKINIILNEFNAKEQSQQCYMISGVRGSGKTVFSDSIKSKLITNKKWIAIELNPATNLLDDLASKLASIDLFIKWFKEAKLNLSAFGFGVEISSGPPIYNLETAITKMLETLKKHNRRVLILIDEVSNSQTMREFASAFQILIRKKLPVYLLMTGLYENIKDLKDEKNLTFLYRTPTIYLDPLNLKEISKNYKANLNVTEDESKEMAKLTKGYSFAFQALGHETWNANKFNNECIKKYKEDLFEYSYSKMWSELSSNDKKVLYGISKTKTGNYGDVLKELNIDKNHLNPYRKRLLDKGIIICPERGKLRFTLPYFDEFTIEAFEDEKYYDKM